MYACKPAYLPFVFYKPEVLEVLWAAFRSTTVLFLDILWKYYVFFLLLLLSSNVFGNRTMC